MKTVLFYFFFEVHSLGFEFIAKHLIRYVFSPYCSLETQKTSPVGLI